MDNTNVRQEEPVQGEPSASPWHRPLAATAEQRAHVDLARSEQRFRLAAAAVSDLVYEWDVDTDRVDWHGDIEAVLGLAAGTMPRTLAAWAERIHPDDRQRLADAVSSHRTSVEPIGEEYRIRHEDGTWRVWMDRGLPLTDAQGRPRLWVGACIDVTERRRGEEELERARTLNEEVVETMSEGLVLSDVDGRIAYVNPALCELVGHERSALLGRPEIDLVPESLRPLVEAACQRRAAGLADRYEVELAHSSGARVPVLVSATPRLERGRPVGSLAVITDLSEMRRLEASLRQAQKMEALGSLAGGIAHDFNNILQTLTLSCELVAATCGEGHSAGEHLDQMASAITRAKDLVGQILSFARRGEDHRRPLLVQSIVREGLRLLRQALPATIDIRTDIDPECPRVEADATQLHQVLVNLCTNAAHAMREDGGVLSLALQRARVAEPVEAAGAVLRPGEYVRLTVVDTGGGIPAEILDSVFEPYFTTKPRGEGTGLGLAVVHGIVSANGGAITANSEPGQGARFDVYLPVTTAPDPPGHKDSYETVPRGRGEHILCVDDEPVICELERALLSSHGYRVTVARSAAEALELVRAAPDRFALVITDQTMPGMNGDRLAGELLRLRPDLPVILCTGFSHRVDEDRARRLGIARFLLKPVTSTELARAVAGALGSRGAGVDAGAAHDRACVERLGTAMEGHRDNPRV